MILSAGDDDASPPRRPRVGFVRLRFKYTWRIACAYVNRRWRRPCRNHRRLFDDRCRQADGADSRAVLRPLRL